MTPEDLWKQIRLEAHSTAQEEPALKGLIQHSILDRESLDEALSWHLAGKLSSPSVPESGLREVFSGVFKADASIIECIQTDLLAVRERDPACFEFLTPFLYFKGFQALSSYRIAHHLWNKGRKRMALFIQSVVSERFAVDIHPAARIGKGILLDHATSFVAGETAVIEDDVSILHEVTLGGTGKETGDRHPKVKRGVLIGAGAKLLGNITIGECSKIGAGSVVLKNIPPHRTVVGVPAEVRGEPREAFPSRGMDHDVCASRGLTE